jgi:hypothetical protein
MISAVLPFVTAHEYNIMELEKRLVSLGNAMSNYSEDRAAINIPES